MPGLTFHLLVTRYFSGKNGDKISFPFFRLHYINIDLPVKHNGLLAYPQFFMGSLLGFLFILAQPQRGERISIGKLEGKA